MQWETGVRDQDWGGSFGLKELFFFQASAACSCGINGSSCDYCVTHLRKASSTAICRREMGREWFGALMEGSRHGNKAETQSEGDPKDGQEAMEDQLRSEGRNLGQSIGNSGI